MQKAGKSVDALSADYKKCFFGERGQVFAMVFVMI